LVRIHHSRHIIIATGFKQENVDFGILGEPARHHRAGGA
jgi:hypothetical protein